MNFNIRGITELEKRLSGDRQELEALMAQPLSVYFDAYRTEDYMDGGEDYLTFHGTSTVPAKPFQQYGNLFIPINSNFAHEFELDNLGHVCQDFPT